MRKNNIFLLSVFSFGIELYGQNTKYFNKHWGAPALVANFANSIVQLNDSSYFITSESNNSQVNNSRVKYIYKFNKVGNQFSVQSDSDLTFQRAIVNKLAFNTIKSKFYLGTALAWYDSLGNGRSVPYIYHFDSLGHFQTPSVIGNTSNIIGGVVYSINYTSSNQLLCAGATLVNYGPSTTIYRASYWKVDTLGNTLWEKRDSSDTCCVREFFLY